MATEGREFSPRDTEANEDAVEMLFSKRRCCFCIPYRSSSSSTTTLGLNWWQRVRVSESQDGSLWDRGINAFKKLREWSEIVAGPRWKTFIRRFNRTKSGGRQSAKFQYDPLSYSLNFDEGPGNNGNSDEEDDFRFRNFSSRYATASVPNKGSIDLGKDGPNFV